jgi:hypothetical protein
MRGIDELAVATVQSQPAGALSHRTGVVTQVNTGPPASLHVRIGDTVVPFVRYATSYHSGVPAVNDVVVVRITRSGGSGRRGGRVRGGAPYVESRIAT